MNASVGRLGKNSIYQDSKFFRATASKLRTNDDNKDLRLITRNMVMIKKNPTGRLRIYATKINFICLDLQKKEKKKY